MNKETLTVYMLLTELKTMDKRIAKTIQEIIPVGIKEAAAKNVNGISEADFKKQALADSQRVTDLIKRHQAMKSALYQYNASKVITVAGREMTIAEALWLVEYGMQSKQALLTKYENAYKKALSDIQLFNGDKLDQLADRAAEVMCASKDKTSNQDYREVVESYKADHQKVLIDPLGLKDLITKMTDEIAIFQAEVDAKIQTANATTEVTIEY